MTTEPQSPLSETEKRVAFLAELRAERERRIFAGKWSRDPRPILTAVVDGESEEVAKRKAFYAHLAMHPDAPKLIHEYDWILHTVVDPQPQVQLPSEQYAPEHAAAVDVTPRPRRPPPSPPPSSSARSLPPAPGAGALSADPARMNIPARIHDAGQRRTRNFNDDTWGDPTGWPIRYPRGNRSGW